MSKTEVPLWRFDYELGIARFHTLSKWRCQPHCGDLTLHPVSRGSPTASRTRLLPLYFAIYYLMEVCCLFSGTAALLLCFLEWGIRQGGRCSTVRVTIASVCLVHLLLLHPIYQLSSLTTLLGNGSIGQR